MAGAHDAGWLIAVGLLPATTPRAAADFPLTASDRRFCANSIARAH
jgi:hypothetical protein